MRHEFRRTLLALAGYGHFSDPQDLGKCLRQRWLQLQVKEVLVGFRILHDRCSLTIHRQNHRSLGVLEVLHDFRRMVAKRRHRLNIFGDVPRRILKKTT